MRLNLHIERLVVDPAFAASRDRDALGAAVVAELHRLLVAGALDVTQGVALPSLHAAPLTVTPGTRAEALGRGVARAIHGGLAPPQGAPRARP